MRTTIEIGDDLLRQAKRKAADEGVPLREIVELALRHFLSGPRRDERYSLSWSTEEGPTQPGVNLDDRDLLFDLMDGRR